MNDVNELIEHLELPNLMLSFIQTRFFVSFASKSERLCYVC